MTPNTPLDDELAALRAIAKAATNLTAVLPDIEMDSAAHVWLYTLGERLIEWQRLTTGAGTISVRMSR